MDVIGQVINGLHSGGHVLMGVVIGEGQQIQVSWWVGKLKSHQNDIRKMQTLQVDACVDAFLDANAFAGGAVFQAKICVNSQQRWWPLTFVPGLPEVPPPFRSGQVATLVEGEVQSVDVVSFWVISFSTGSCQGNEPFQDWANRYKSYRKVLRYSHDTHH